MNKLVVTSLLLAVSGLCSAATVINLDNENLFTTNPQVVFDTDINLLRIQSNESLTCNGGDTVTPDLTKLSLQVDGNPPVELQGQIAIERNGADTVVTIASTDDFGILCTFVDEILMDGFEDPIVGLN
ncbi:MAG: hypothetical protein Tsb002_34850 [Wenzhouxiangellaceae bacterium]